jgi:hypothetical protein
VVAVVVVEKGRNALGVFISGLRPLLLVLRSWISSSIITTDSAGLAGVVVVIVVVSDGKVNERR